MATLGDRLTFLGDYSPLEKWLPLLVDAIVDKRWLIGAVMGALASYFYCKPPRRAVPLPRPRTLTDASWTSALGATRPHLPTLESMPDLEDEEANTGSVYFGPSVDQFVYATFSPPLSWTEASRRLIPRSKDLKGELRLSTDGRLEIRRSSEIILLEDYVVSVERPVEMGVLKIHTSQHVYEHTFSSARSAAQFQKDVLAIQIMGRRLKCLYETFELLQQGSPTCTKQELVWHDKEVGEAEDHTCGAAWDDLFRCLANVPSMRRSLEDLISVDPVLNGRVGDVMPHGSASSKSLSPDLTDQYTDKRLLLGPVDFFRLFVPFVPLTAVPILDTERHRLEDWLRRRKRLSRAAIMVQMYSRARHVANLGWSLGRKLPSGSTTRRVSFDTVPHNKAHDLSSSNEYYEPVVSRDNICHVRGAADTPKCSMWDFRLDRGHPSRSGVQGYSLVGVQAFAQPSNDDDPDFPLQHWNDPVLAIPSLRELIEKNHDMDFFVQGFFSVRQKICVISVFVRSLARGVDPSFDRSTDCYVNGNEESRDDRLEVIFHLGLSRAKPSFASKVLLAMWSFLLRASPFRPRSVPRAAQSVGRVSLPAMKISQCGRTNHFGGSLQTDAALPKNYVSQTVNLDPLASNSVATRMLLGYLDSNHFPNSIVDCTFLVSAPEGEVHERALGSFRSVRVPWREVALPPHFTGRRMVVPGVDEDDTVQRTRTMESNFSLLVRVLVTDPAIAFMLPLARAIGRKRDDRHRRQRRPSLLVTRRSSVMGLLDQIEEKHSADETWNIVSSDPLETAINELVGILADVTVPVRKQQVEGMLGFHQSPFPLVEIEHTASAEDVMPLYSGGIHRYNEAIIRVPVLHCISRCDIRRFYIASDCKLKLAGLRIVESATWRGLTFPVDTRTCRIELQNAQFFQQGNDRRGNPVFYFRHMCLGPWRHDDNAVIAAVLHRFDRNLRELRVENDDVKVTLVITMGKPFKPKKKDRKDSQATKPSVNEKETPGQSEIVPRDSSDDEEETVGTDEYSKMALAGSASANNPRINKDEKWNPHTSIALVRKITGIAMTHYPETLHQALVVVGHGNTSYFRSAVGGMLKLSRVVGSSKTREKVLLLPRYADLREFISTEELVTLVGGLSPIREEAFHCV